MSSSTRATSACSYGAGSAAPGSVAARTSRRMGGQILLSTGSGARNSRPIRGECSTDESHLLVWPGRQIGDCVWALRRPLQYASGFATVHRLVERECVGEQTQVLARL